MTERPRPMPDLDWDPKTARAFGDDVLDLWQELLERIRELPVARRHDHDTVRAAVITDIPSQPMPLEELIERLRSITFDYSMYPGSPGFMAYVSGPGTVPGAVADLLAGGLNQNLGGWRLSPAGTEIENDLTRWFAERFGLPEGAGGIFTSGGAMANFVALKRARDVKAGWDVRRDGVAAGPRMTIYASNEVHNVTDRAADMLGLGDGAVRRLPVDDAYRLDLKALERAIESDLEEGLKPIAVVGSAGTVGTGSIDPLQEIAAICRQHELWFHVDGAYGALAMLSEELRPLFAGIEHADSIAFDPHKWLYTPHSGGCVVIRDFQSLGGSFSIDASYVHTDKERSGFGDDLRHYGPQFSRGFQGLKVWVSLLAHGTDAYGRRIAQDVALAKYLRDEAERRSDFEVMAPTILSITCFRYVPADLPQGAGREAYLSLLNQRLMTELQLDGRTYCSNAVLNDAFVLRACIVNFRTEADDVDHLLDVCADIGSALDAQLRPEDLKFPAG